MRPSSSYSPLLCDHVFVRQPVVDTAGFGVLKPVHCVFAINGVAGLILPGQLWDRGHVDDDPRRYSGPEHRRCNRRTVSHRARREHSS